MIFDYWLFDVINGIAGRYAWLDRLGQWVALYGLLTVLLLVLAVVWWPGRERDVRRRYVLALLASVAAWAMLLGAEWFLTTHILHQDLRARPDNVRWVTLLIADRSHLAFPAWPVVLAFALAVPTCLLARWAGITAVVLGSLLAISLVFVGVNYPFDVFTGLLLGSAIGLSASLLLREGNGRRNAVWRHPGVAWAVLLLWCGIMLVTVKPARSSENAPASVADASVTVTPPAALAPALASIVKPGTLTLQAATNGHLLVASVQIMLPDARVSLQQVETLARETTNLLFARWKALDLLTVEVDANFPQGTHQKVGTLYTTTVERTQWPAGGFAPDRRLPGLKFYHAQFLSHAVRSPQHAPLSNGGP